VFDENEFIFVLFPCLFSKHINGSWKRSTAAALSKQKQITKETLTRKKQKSGDELDDNLIESRLNMPPPQEDDESSTSAMETGVNNDKKVQQILHLP